MLSWRDFDPEVVRAIEKRDADAINSEADGGMRCPLVGHGEFLAWVGGDRRQGTAPHGQPAIRFYSTPTFVYVQPLDNVISGLDLVEQMLGGSWGKAETYRLGNERSEDALSWNVFRSLQESQSLKLVAGELLGNAPIGEPRLFMWGREIGLVGASNWPELATVRNMVEPGLRQQTEPDVVLHVSGWGWLFIEAKFGSPLTTFRGREGRLKEWFKRYERWCDGVLDVTALRALEAKRFPEQLLRNLVIAAQVKAHGERAMVVYLTRGQALEEHEEIFNALFDSSPVGFATLSWERIYELARTDQRLNGLGRYFEEKSLALRRAFNV